MQEYLVAECEAFVGCGCVAPDEFGVDMATCLATRGAELAAVAAQGYAWDPECAAVRLAGLADACAGGDGAYTCEMFACTLFHGEVGYGEKCEVTIGSTDWWDGTTCAAGLACQGLCVPRCGDLVTCGLEICAPGQVCYDIDDIGLMCGSASGPGEACYPGTMASVWSGVHGRRRRCVHVQGRGRSLIAPERLLSSASSTYPGLSLFVIPAYAGIQLFGS